MRTVVESTDMGNHEQEMMRTTVLRISALGAIVSLLGLIVAFALPVDFVLRVAIWFLFFLIAFHWYFASVKRLTARGVRLIDYVYLGVATFGVFVHALTYGDKRAAYTSARDLESIRTDLGTVRTELAHAAIAIQA